MSRAGYLLAGGRSTRMGRDKALLPFRGGALADSVARAVEQAAGSSLCLAGWKGVAAAPKAMPVCALALFPGEDELRPLDGCQTVGDIPATR